MVIGTSHLMRPTHGSISVLYRVALATALLYATWIGMLATHELGHCLHAWLSGGRVIQVSLAPLGFSQTIVHPNPRELLVVWGGPIWGALLPLIACGIARLLPLPGTPGRGLGRGANGAWTRATGHSPPRASSPSPQPSPRTQTRGEGVMRFFAGFCLIANGAYIGVGWIWHAGDAGDLLRLGTPRGVMVAFGAACVVAGLAMWHHTSWLTTRTAATRR
jgi:hypothetical protein